MANAPKENQRVGDDLELGYALPSPITLLLYHGRGSLSTP